MHDEVIFVMTVKEIDWSEMRQWGSYVQNAQRKKNWMSKNLKISSDEHRIHRRNYKLSAELLGNPSRLIYTSKINSIFWKLCDESLYHFRQNNTNANRYNNKIRRYDRFNLQYILNIKLTNNLLKYIIYSNGIFDVGKLSNFIYSD